MSSDSPSRPIRGRNRHDRRAKRGGSAEAADLGQRRGSAEVPAPRQRRAFSTIGGPVEIGGEPDEARALGRLFDVEPALARALTHGFHSYAGRMHPSIARGAVARWSTPGDLVVDPFCGSGTVLVEAMGQGRRSIGIDASPLGVAIARVRTATLGEGGRRRLVEAATRIAEESGTRARKRRRPEIPRWARGEQNRFHPHVALELYGLRELVMAEPGDEIGRALRLCLSSILVKLMRAGPEAPRDGGDKRIARGVPSRLFGDRARELSVALEALERRTPSGTPAPRVEEGDARDLRGLCGDGSAVLVCSSPPYAGTYDYAAQHDVRFTWLELPRRRLEQRQIGGRKPVGGARGGADSRGFREARRRWVGELARILRPGGHAFLVAGDGVVGGLPEYAPDGVAEDASTVGLDPVARASQARPIHDRRLSDVFAGRQRFEHLLLLRRR